jgi:hypothetical protein
MENPKNQIVDRIKEANNVLVTVSANPSVDQLAAAIGLTLLLNKLGKHGTAVFSGRPPSTIEFLKPEETLEKTTDSLRDFIIALDKSKADKLRYKVEDKMVKIFITPYQTSINEDDLEFSQGDFNVDVVVGLGVRVQEDLDEAIISHGRILHDATVVSINTTEAGSLGTINWVDNESSSLSEMIVAMADMLKTGLFDEQIATALLTGIVAETERFSNSKTTSNTMAASAKLMAAGANQQLIATKLQEPPSPEEPEEESSEDDTKPPAPDDDTGEGGDENPDGSLQIDHDEEDLPAPQPDPAIDNVDIDEQGNLKPLEDDKADKDDRALEYEDVSPPPEIGDPKAENDGRITEPPSRGGQLTANSEPEGLDLPTDPLIQAADTTGPLLSHDSGPAALENPGGLEDWVQKAPAPTPDSPSVPTEPPTLAQIEEEVGSPHTDVAKAPEPAEAVQNEAPVETAQPGGDKPDVGDARDAVQAAITDTPPEAPLEPIAALNAQPVDLDLGHENPQEPMAPLDQPSTPEPADVSKPSDVHIDPNGNFNYLDQPGNIPAPDPVAPPLADNSGVVPAPDPLPPVDNNGLPTNLVPPAPGLPADPTASPGVDDPTAPPPVPPPMMPPMMPPS